MSCIDEGKKMFPFPRPGPGNSVCPKPQFFFPARCQAEAFCRLTFVILLLPPKTCNIKKKSRRPGEKASGCQFSTQDFGFQSSKYIAFSDTTFSCLGMQVVLSNTLPIRAGSPRVKLGYEAIDLLEVTNIFATKLVSYCKGLAFSKEDANTV